LTLLSNQYQNKVRIVLEDRGGKSLLDSCGVAG